MILPGGAENMSDVEVVRALLDDGVYDEVEARAVVQILRHGPAVD